MRIAAGLRALRTSKSAPWLILSQPANYQTRSWHSSVILRVISRRGKLTNPAARSTPRRKVTELQTDKLPAEDKVTEKVLDDLGLKYGIATITMMQSTCARYYDRPKPEIIPNMRRYLIEETIVKVQSLEDKNSPFDPGPLGYLEGILADLSMLRSEPALASEVCYIAAHRMWNSSDQGGPESLPLAKYMLSIALAMGNQKAALDLAHIAHDKADGVIPPAALREIRAATMDSTDSRAMTIYTRYLLRLQKEADQHTRKQAFDLATNLCAVMEPASADRVIRLTSTPVHKEEAPWVLLRDAALQRLMFDYPDKSDPTHKSIDAALVSALRQGVEEYNDPEACRDLSDHSSIDEFSPEWVRLKEKSAMHGHSESCYNLGRYYLEYWGWYPCIGKPLSKRPEAMLAFDWLELSAEGCLDDAKLMCDRYLILALTLRENALQKEGHEVVKRGIQSIEKFSTDSRSRHWAIRQLQPYDRSWDYVTARVEVLLGDLAKPKLSKEKRYQPQGWRRLLGG